MHGADQLLIMSLWTSCEQWTQYFLFDKITHSFSKTETYKITAFLCLKYLNTMAVNMLSQQTWVCNFLPPFEEPLAFLGTEAPLKVMMVAKYFVLCNKCKSLKQ